MLWCLNKLYTSKSFSLTAVFLALELTVLTNLICTNLFLKPLAPHAFDVVHERYTSLNKGPIQ